MHGRRHFVLAAAIVLLPSSAGLSPGTSGVPPDDLLSKIRIQVTSDNIPATNFDGHWASCPTGTVAFGGGVDSSGANDQTVIITSPTVSDQRMGLLGVGSHAAPDGWFASVASTSTSVEWFKVGVVCVPTTPGMWLTVVGSTTSGGFGKAEHVCPAGYIALGGGTDVSDMPTMNVTSSTPLVAGQVPSLVSPGTYPAPSGWSGSARSSDVRVFWVGVVCGQEREGIRTIVVHASAAAHGTKHIEAACPAGFKAIGGGVSATNIYTVQVTASGPAYGTALEGMISGPDGLRPAPDGWEADVRNEGASAQTVAIATVCAYWPLMFFRGD